jgi:undecaprenyl-diphosphatase
MHVATALGMLVYFHRDWARIVGALFTSVKTCRIDHPEQRLAWLLVLATIPVGLVGLALATTVQTVLGKPVPAAIFLVLNGVVLFVVEHRERARHRSATPATVLANPAPSEEHSLEHEEERTVDFPTEPTLVISADDPGLAADRNLARLSLSDALLIGASQSLALLPGISRSGITIAAGLHRGLPHSLAARLAFLLSTPVILAAGVLKVPELFASANQGILGPAVVGSLVAGVAAYASTRFLTSYFQRRTLTPFAVYCTVVGLGGVLVLSLR